MPATMLAVNVAPVPIVEYIAPASAVSCAALGAMVPVSRCPIASVPVATAVVPVPPADHCRKNSRKCENRRFLEHRKSTKGQRPLQFVVRPAVGYMS